MRKFIAIIAILLVLCSCEEKTIGSGSEKTDYDTTENVSDVRDTVRNVVFDRDGMSNYHEYLYDIGWNHSVIDFTLSGKKMRMINYIELSGIVETNDPNFGKEQKLQELSQYIGWNRCGYVVKYGNCKYLLYGIHDSSGMIEIK